MVFRNNWQCAKDSSKDSAIDDCYRVERGAEEFKRNLINSAEYHYHLVTLETNIIPIVLAKRYFL